MELYVFTPQGHGQLSFYVMANSTAEAWVNVEMYIKKNLIDEKGELKYEAQGWGTDYYLLEVAKPHQVLINDN